MTKTKATIAIFAMVLIVGVSVPAIYFVANGQSAPRPAASTEPDMIVTSISAVGPVHEGLPPGMTFKVLAVRHFQEERWVSPDGEELNSLPVDTKKLLSHMGVSGKSIAFLTEEEVPADVSAKVSILPSGTWSHYTRSGESVGGKDYNVYLVSCNDLPNFVVSVDAATGPWDTLHIPANAKKEVELDVQGKPLVRFDPPVEVEKHAEIVRHGSAQECFGCCTAWMLQEST